MRTNFPVVHWSSPKTAWPCAGAATIAIPTRRDNVSRSEFLRLHIEEVIRIVRDEIPLIGYLHWSLFDNYEWGTYTPRFGLYSLNYQAGAARLERDHHGDTPAQTYALLIREANRKMQAGIAGRPIPD